MPREQPRSHTFHLPSPAGHGRSERNTQLEFESLSMREDADAMQEMLKSTAMAKADLESELGTVRRVKDGVRRVKDGWWARGQRQARTWCR